MICKSYRKLVEFNREKMKKVNLFETHRMFADLYCMLPGQEQQLHTHADNDKIYHVLEGEGAFTLGDEVHTLGTGAICVARAGVPHGVRNDSDGGLVLLVCMAPHPSTAVADE